KRPDLELVSGLADDLQRRHGFELVLTGAPYEADINKQFSQIHQGRNRHRIVDLAGKTGLIELAGAIKACDLFISADSGPDHSPAALGVPTLAIFHFSNPVHYHHDSWVRCIVVKCGTQSLSELVEVSEELLAARVSTQGSSLARVGGPDSASTEARAL